MGNRKYAIFFLLALAIIGTDQWTKHWILTHFWLGQRRDLWNPLFAFTYVRNRGAAFSLLDSAPAAFRDPFFTALPFVALAFIFVLLRRAKASDKLFVVALGLISGGAVGNLIDRLELGYVVDFIDVHWKEVYHWPRFNIADSAICVGVGLIFLQSLLRSEPASKPDVTAAANRPR